MGRLLLQRRLGLSAVIIALAGAFYEAAIDRRTDL